jgi:aspartate aminotransferase
MHISKRLQALRPSETLAITAKARMLQAQGHDVVALAAGEPDFPPPDHVRQAVAREAVEGLTRYGPAAGSLPARQALAGWIERTRGLTYHTDQIVLTNGGKQALYEALAGIIDPGDEVLILAPYWVTYPAQVELLGGVPKYLEATDAAGFKVDPDRLRGAIGPKTRGVIFNNPCNPTGSYYGPAEVRVFTEICVEAGIAILSDEVYDAITYSEEPYLTPAAVSPEAAALTVVLNSLSKTYAMPGWRIGYLAGPLDWMKRVASFQGQITHHPSSLAQAAIAASYGGDQACVEEMRREFQQRRDFLMEKVPGIPGFEVATAPQGAFYLFPRITRLIEALPGGGGSTEACSWLLDQAKVALVPGAAFGAEGFLRISYAAARGDLEKAVERLGEATARLGID